MLVGNDDAGTESLVAWEVGYRRQVTDAVTVGVSTSDNQYSDVIDIPYLVFQTTFRF